MGILELAHGIHRDVPAATYHERHLGLVSKSALDIVDRSPGHYKAWVDRLVPDETSEELDYGALFHEALLEPDSFGATYIVQPDFGDQRFKENKQLKANWMADNAGRIGISKSNSERISAMVKAIHAHPLAGKMVRDGEAELTWRWQDPDTGLECKARTDYYVRKHRMIVDVKTARDASFEGFRKSVANYRYHVQDALYRSAAAAVGEPVDHFVFLAIEKVEPFAIGLYVLDQDSIARGNDAAYRNRARLAECVNANSWPTYATSIQTLNLPPWAA